jgi:phosphate acetyltransferase
MQSEFINRLVERVKAAPKSIIFAEPDMAKVLQAAQIAYDLGAIRPIFVGKEEDAWALASENGVDTGKFDWIDHTDEITVQKLSEDYLAVSDMLSEKVLNKKIKEPLNFAAAAVKAGWTDCLAAGNRYSTGEVVLAGYTFIGLAPGIGTVSSLGIVESPYFNEGSQGNMVVFADAAVNQNPTAEMLADIAITTADTVARLTGWEPRVGLLSFSTDGSSEGGDVDRVREARDIAQERRPDLAIDGEFQIDSALLAGVAEKKMKRESTVAGKANIVIFPNLAAGNIAVKVAQIFGKCLAPGPLMQGFEKPVTDFSRSAPAEEIAGNLVMLACSAV